MGVFIMIIVFPLKLNSKTFRIDKQLNVTYMSATQPGLKMATCTGTSWSVPPTIKITTVT